MRSIVGFLLLFALAAEPATGPMVVATVNGDAIPLADVDAALKRRLTLAGPLTSAQVKQLRTEAANDLVDDLLLKQFVAKNAPAPVPEELATHVAAVAAAQRKQGRTLAAHCRSLGISESQFRESLAQSLRFRKLVDHQTTETKYRAFFEANRDAIEGAQVRASHIMLRLGPTAADGEKAAAREKLRQIAARIAAGTLTFAEAARKYSLCPTAAAGGDLGAIRRKDGTVDDAVAAAAFALKVGAVSEPVASEFGMHLVTVRERTAGTPTTYEAAADAVKDLYAEEVRQSLVVKLRAEGRVQVVVP